MEKNFIICASFLLTFFLYLQAAIAQPPVCDWRGYAQINTTSVSLVNTSHIVTSYTNGSQATNGTTFNSGYYIIPVPGTNGDNITLQICGVNVAQGFQTWSCAAPGYNILNISINTSANGVSCTYDCGCASNYCVHGTCRASSTYCGDGYCDTGESCSSCSSDCGSCPSGVGAAPAAEVGVTVTKTISLASPTAPAIAAIEADKAKDLKIDEVKIEVKEAVTNVQVTVKESSLPSGATVAISADVGATYKYVEITTTVPSAKVEKVKIKFKVEKSWITSNNIDDEKVALQKYADNKWNKLTTSKVSSDATYVYYEAETTALSVFAITGEKKVIVAPVEEKKCPACPQPSAWSDCVANKQIRTNYRCSAETNYECQSYTEEQVCEVAAPPITAPKLPKISNILIFTILAVILFLVLYQFGKGKVKLPFQRKKKEKVIFISTKNNIISKGK